MDKFSFKSEKNPRTMIWNVLTVAMLVGTVCMCGYFLLIFSNPYSGLNFFRPPVQPTALVPPTATITPRQLPPTWTPTDTIEPTATNTKRPTWTPIPTDTIFILPSPTSRFTPTRTMTPSRTPKPTGMPYAVGAPTYLASTIYHPEAGCNWLGVAGMAVDTKNAPILYLVVHVTGLLDGDQIDIPTLTGAAPAYGQSGFEIFLSDHTIDSISALWIQVFDQAGNALTEKVYFNTYADCTRNLVLFRITQLH
jgi:hypothetical protein